MEVSEQFREPVPNQIDTSEGFVAYMIVCCV